MNLRAVFYGAVAGAIGGALGWLPGELIAIPRPSETMWRYVLIALYFVVVGACIGACLGALDGIANRIRARAIQGAKVGGVLGLVGGAIGSFPGESAFEALNAVDLGLVGRALGWAIVGIFIGLAQGIGTRDRTRLFRGALGGLLGGYLGGGFFEIVSLVLARDLGSRWIAVVVLGACLGAFITFFQEWLSDAWLVVVSSGRQEGQKYNITKGETRLGHDDHDDFILFAGENIIPHHALITRKPDGLWIRPMAPANPVLINKQPVQGEQRLRHGNEVTLGSLTLRFQEQTIRCPQCNMENAARAQFCFGCGRKLVSK
jgi:hypothetical protein